MKLTDMPRDSWFRILGAIERGDRPGDNDLAKAFLRGEPLSLEQQRILARLFDGSLKRGRGRPKNKRLQTVETAEERRYDDYGLYKWINELADELRAKGIADPLAFEEALKQVTAEVKKGAPETIRRRYNAGKPKASSLNKKIPIF